MNYAEFLHRKSKQINTEERIHKKSAWGVPNSQRLKTEDPTPLLVQPKEKPKSFETLCLQALYGE